MKRNSSSTAGLASFFSAGLGVATDIHALTLILLNVAILTHSLLQFDSMSLRLLSFGDSRGPLG